MRATNHYADDGDKPIRTQESATAYTRNVDGLAGVSGIWQSATNSAQWQISNLNGDIVAAVAGSGAGLTVTREFDEFGRTPSAEAGRTRYGWLGKEQRASDAPAGLMLMGLPSVQPGQWPFPLHRSGLRGQCQRLRLLRG